ncbi:MAG: hypothetical protein ACXW1D_00140 [Halobacteriota archaeon]
MKRTVRVIIEKEVELDIPDCLLTPEHIKAFNDYIGLDADVDDIEACRAELFRFVGRLKALYDDADHAEGMGYMGSEYMRPRMAHPEEFIISEVTYEDIEAEMVE